MISDEDDEKYLSFLWLSDDGIDLKIVIEIILVSRKLHLKFFIDFIVSIISNL